MSGRLLVLAHAVFTVAMFGFMLAVQLVIYPQFRSTTPDNFASYAADHAGRIVTGLALLAPLEVILALWLFLDTPAALNRSAVFIAGLLLAIAWIATGAWFAPLHGDFQQGYDPAKIDQLITTNWLRTLLWAARAALASWFVWQLLANTAPD